MTNRAPHVPDSDRAEYEKSCFPEAVAAQGDQTPAKPVKPAAKKAPAKPAKKGK